MSPVSRSSAVGARVKRRSKARGSTVADSDYVDPWDLENELYVKRLSVVGDPPVTSLSPPEPTKASSRKTSNCYYDIAGFEEEDFQNERLYSYDGGEDLDAEYWMQSAYGDYYYYDDDFGYGGVDPGYDPYHRYKPATCFPCPVDGLHTYEECEQKQTIYSDEYYIPMSSGNFYPCASPVGYQLYSPTRRSLASNHGSQQLKRVYETRKSRMALPAEDAGFYERDYYGSWRWKESGDNQRMSVLSGYYSDEVPGDLTDDSLGGGGGGGGSGDGPGGPAGSPYADLRGPPPPIPASHFGLTKHGHLKIDYSCNWSSLDRFIGHQNRMAGDGRNVGHHGGSGYLYKAPSSNHVY
ncbi:uncharacterized protein LOC124158582 [Ischnura elegans]|uniref:uncharacterized protein LOC124158582 n=1 Tax=Ischnura elegans TaxID=197161 RepID=UPI001ED88F91|nr:uncharacterized protein LOC124158582 [Ischnura elegans]